MVFQLKMIWVICFKLLKDNFLKKYMYYNINYYKLYDLIKDIIYIIQLRKKKLNFLISNNINIRIKSFSNIS